MRYIFKKYEDNLDEEKLKTVPTERLQEVVDSCDRAGNGAYCEICSAYLWEIERRKEA